MDNHGTVCLHVLIYSCDKGFVNNFITYITGHVVLLLEVDSVKQVTRYPDKTLVFTVRWNALEKSCELT